jgi:hypothetical protein
MAFRSVAAVAALVDLCCSSVAAAGCARIIVCGLCLGRRRLACYTCCFLLYLLYLLLYTRRSACPYTIARHIFAEIGVKGADFLFLHTPQRMPIYDRSSHFAEREVKGAEFQAPSPPPLLRASESETCSKTPVRACSKTPVRASEVSQYDADACLMRYGD